MGQAKKIERTRDHYQKYEFFLLDVKEILFVDISVPEIKIDKKGCGVKVLHLHASF